MITQYHRLNSNTNDDVDSGFQVDEQFAATAVFDLDNAADAFGLRLNDPGDSANNARLLLLTNANNDTLVHLSNFDMSGSSVQSTTLGVSPITFAESATQIAFTFQHVGR